THFFARRGPCLRNDLSGDCASARPAQAHGLRKHHLRKHGLRKPTAVVGRVQSGASKTTPARINTASSSKFGGFITMEHLVAVVVTVSFALFLIIAAVAGIVGDYKKRSLELEPLRTALERGQQLDPALLEHLPMRNPPEAGSQLEPV